MHSQDFYQIARDIIKTQLLAGRWVIHDKKKFYLAAGLSVAIRAYQTDTVPADCVLFADKKLMGIIEGDKK